MSDPRVDIDGGRVELIDLICELVATPFFDAAGYQPFEGRGRTVSSAPWPLVGAAGGRLGAGPYASKASAVVSAGAAALIVASAAT